MKIRRFGSFLATSAVVSMLLSMLVLGAPGLTPQANAQVGCSVNSEAQLVGCINTYNGLQGSNSDLTIFFTQGVPINNDLPVINNTVSPPPKLLIDGRGLWLQNVFNTTGVYMLRQDAGDVEIRDLKVKGLSTQTGFDLRGGSATVVGSTFAGNNEALLMFDAATGSTLEVVNSTIVDNEWGFIGGPPAATMTATIRQSTFFNDNADLAKATSATVTGSLLGGGVVACIDGPPVDGGGNVVEDDTCFGSSSATPGLDGSFETVLADNDCMTPCTQTLALLAGSPAIDAHSGCAAGVDQRGVFRSAGSCDAGAFELQPCLADLEVGNEAELGFAIDCYNAGTEDKTVTMTGDIVLSAQLPFIDNPTETPPTLTFDGGGFTLNADDGDAGTPGFPDVLVMSGGVLDLSDLTLMGATNTGFVPVGGTATIRDSTIVGMNHGVYVLGGNTTITNSTLFDQAADGVFVSGGRTITIDQSTIVNNATGIDGGTNATATLTGSLVSRGAGGSVANCSASVAVTDGGGNAFTDTTCNGSGDDALGDVLDTELRANGCGVQCTFTLALTAPSSATDAYTDCHGGLDQRGVTRAANKCDAGAYELGDCDTTYNVQNEVELAHAIACYNAAPGGETVTATFTDNIAPTAALPDIENSNGATFELNGAGFTLDGSALGPGIGLLEQTNGDTELTNLTVTGGSLGSASFSVIGGDATVTASTFHSNFAAIYTSSLGAVEVVNSTIADNDGGGIFVEAGAAVTVRQSTIVNNGGPGISDGNAAAAIIGSLLAGNNGFGIDAECAGGDHTGSSGNVIDDDTCLGIAATPDVVGTYADTLADNGCTRPCTQTIALLPGSPAIGANSGCVAGDTDQRGEERSVGACDAGAYEFDICGPSFSVADEAELASAIECYNGGSKDVSITLTSNVALSGNLPFIHNDLAGPATLRIDGGGHTLSADPSAGSLFGFVVVGGDVAVSDVSITDFDWGLFANVGSVLISKSTFTRNTFGVGLSEPSAAVIDTSTFVGNLVAAIHLEGSSEFTLVNSTIVDNGLGNPNSAVGGIALAPGQSSPSPVAHLSGSFIFGNGGLQCDLDLQTTDDGGNMVEDPTCTGAGALSAGFYESNLADNGCMTSPCTQTIALLAGSPAIDVNTSCVAGTTDQRGVTRTTGTCDAGAFEAGDLDADGDGFRGPLGNGTDCDDTKSAVNPGATEVPYNGVDEDCSGGDLVDGDGDGFAAGKATGGTPDCDDTKSGVNPGATEIADDGIDQDCDGQDLVTVVAVCNGLTVTINLNTNGGNGTGTAGDDVILGTPGDDVITGLAGDDTICAGDGNDQVVGGDGDDTIFGEGGRDILRGSPGVDTMSGGDGNDRVLGGIGNDIMNGDAGDDYLGGFGGHDTINGGPGNETIFGGFGRDTIDGGPGNDKIFGLIGDDIINGGSGNDQLNGDAGNDTINGGTGNDTIQGGNANDILNGDAGDDSVSGGKADDQLSGGPDIDVCIGNKHIIGDTADNTCETTFGVP